MILVLATPFVLATSCRCICQSVNLLSVKGQSSLCTQYMLHEQLTLQMTWLRWWVPADNVNNFAATAFCCYSAVVLQHDTCLSRLAGKDA